MSTSSQVETQWETSIWTSQTVRDMNARYFLHDVSQESGFHVAQLYSDEASGEAPTINFFLCLVSRRQEPNQIMGGGSGVSGTRYTFSVRVEYYLQQTDVAAETYRLHRDRLEAVDDLVRTALGSRWGNTVDFWQGGVPLTAPPATIDGKSCWKGGYTYAAVRTT